MADPPKQATDRAAKVATKRPTVQPGVHEAPVLDEPGLVAPAEHARLDPGHSRPNDVLALQQLAGNRATHSVIRRGESPVAGAPASLDRALTVWPSVQAKLTVGPVGDVYEEEADRVAEQVLAMPTVLGGKTALAVGKSPARRQPEEDEDALQEKRETPRLQRQEEEEEGLQGSLSLHPSSGRMRTRRHFRGIVRTRPFSLGARLQRSCGFDQGNVWARQLLIEHSGSSQQCEWLVGR